QVGDVVSAFDGGGAFERIPVGSSSVVVPAPAGVEVVHLAGDGIGVGIADAEDDGLLFGAARREQLVKEVFAHRRNAVGKRNLGLVRGRIVALSGIRGLHNFSRVGVSELQCELVDVVAGDTLLINIHDSADD